MDPYCPGRSILATISYKAYFVINPHAYVNFTTFKPAHENMDKPQLVLQGHERSIFDGFFDDETAAKRNVYIEYLIKDDLYVDQEKNNDLINDCSGMSHDSCSERRTPHGQDYVLLKEFSHRTQIRFVKEGTLIKITDNTGKTRSIDEWDNLIDSFEPTPLKDIPYKFFKYWEV